MSALRISLEDPFGAADIAALTAERLAFSAANSPPGSNYAYGLDRMADPDFLFWTARDGDGLLGCVALRLGQGFAELKSMYLRPAARGRGVGTALVSAVITEAERRRFSRLYLETGHEDAYIPARTLYLKFGFTPCGPFPPYEFDPSSLYMEKQLLP